LPEPAFWLAWKLLSCSGGLLELRSLMTRDGRDA
jgi:hypothetical protein